MQPKRPKATQTPRRRTIPPGYDNPIMRRCANCLNPITESDRYATGWTHDGEWRGVRCPGKIQPALPIGEQVAEDLALLAAAANLYAGDAVDAQLRTVIDRWSTPVS
jgi:hypothetical protein